MTPKEVCDILSKIKYSDWNLYLGDDNGRMYLQVQFWEEDLANPDNGLQLQKSRKWMLSPHMVPNEIVRTAYKAIKTAVAHEVDERFTYMGASIYNPHISADALVEASKHIEVRK